ncbi:hypothetical protein QNO00_02695 [Arthrobacter sp. zg-Y1219]|uniref:hypothetical protein n=1 Tax=Arthrobacter sp. zg-Y1219 TaxID=3049067 RepID=UPI0024C32E3B|nr:hypothetical protein [Arthrobacter sp. zg-Y1219]MDK1359182.1 hypothetical protein [Arthrobacter sp. zg-Y1219]
MGLDDLMSDGDAREREREQRIQDDWDRQEAKRRVEAEREEFRKREEARSNPHLALKHLEEVRTAAAAEDAVARAEASRINGQVLHLLDVESRFVRRRDHFLTAGEANPAESRQVAELAGTAERLRQGVEAIRKRLAPSEERVSAQAKKTSGNLARIDKAITRLNDAMKSLELVKLEQANQERIKSVERASFERLAQLGGAYGIQPATEVTAASTQVDVDYRVREVTRLAYEAEALVELQRERLS